MIAIIIISSTTNKATKIHKSTKFCLADILEMLLDLQERAMIS
jgi:hypothetical protein